MINVILLTVRPWTILGFKVYFQEAMQLHPLKVHWHFVFLLGFLIKKNVLLTKIILRSDIINKTYVVLVGSSMLIRCVMRLHSMSAVTTVAAMTIRCAVPSGSSLISHHIRSHSMICISSHFQILDFNYFYNYFRLY